MRELAEGLIRLAERAGGRPLFSDGQTKLSRAEAVTRIAGLANEIASRPRIVGLLAHNGVDCAIAHLACAFSGKLLVPLPTFFSKNQLDHVIRDAGVELILATRETRAHVDCRGLPVVVIENAAPAEPTRPVDGFGEIIYTSGSTGSPKGVCHLGGQLEWMVNSLALATRAGETDFNLSVLPLAMLLEALCAIFVPALVGAQSVFDRGIADAMAIGRPSSLASAFKRTDPTTSVLVPQLLAKWVEELAQARERAPARLRLLAVGGAPVSQRLATTARSFGIPVFEGYGLSECASVVSLNRAGECKLGTCGRPLPGLHVSIDASEIVVEGPSVMDGYLGAPHRSGPWRTGDLGAIDDEGYLTILGRKDNIIVTSAGRNVSPEWIEAMILHDSRILHCSVTSSRVGDVRVLAIPQSQHLAWFQAAEAEEVMKVIRALCASAPDYAIPTVCRVLSLADVQKEAALTPNGRIVRRVALRLLEGSDGAD